LTLIDVAVLRVARLAPGIADLLVAACGRRRIVARALPATRVYG
jgi:hypothetical protein